MPKQLRFNHLFLKDGLVEPQVYQMEQDKEGYMWFGTRTGLVRFDGYNPKTYEFKTKKIQRTNVSALYNDKNGVLWAGAAYEGLFYYDRNNDTFVHCKADRVNEELLQLSSINKIQDDGNGNLWLNILNKINSVTDEKIADESLMLYNKKTKQFTNFGNAVKGNEHVQYKQYFSPLVISNKGNIFCGSDSGLYQYDKKSKRFKHVFNINDSLYKADIYSIAINPEHPEFMWFLRDNELIEYNTLRKSKILQFSTRYENITQLSFDSNNQLWFAGSKGLSCFDNKTNKFIKYNNNSITEFKEDISGNFWCKTNKGISYFNKKNKQFNDYNSNKTTDGLYEVPYTLFTGRNGALWISVTSAGIQWVNKQASTIEKYEVLPKIEIYEFTQSEDSSVWLATNTGLYHWMPKTNSFINIPIEKNVISSIECIISGSNNNIWLGSSGNYNGVYCYNSISKKITNYRYNKNDTATISASRIGALLEDKKGNIWIGTWHGGLCMLNPKTQKIKRFPFIVNLENTPNENKLDDRDAIELYEDKTGVLWIGTNAGSLNRFDEKTQNFVSYQNSNNHFRCVLRIKEDHKNRLWASTYSGGLFLFNRANKTAKNINVKNGLLSNTTAGLLIDNNDNIWLNSAKGISIYNAQTGHVRTVMSEILKTNFSPFCSFKTKQGLFIFPIDDGFAIVNPDDFKPDSITPVVHIESIIYNKPQSKNKEFDSTIVRYGKDKVKLKYNENRITFNYVGLIYQNVEQVKYKYRLDGYDKDWVNANTQRTATYTNLAPGTYTFHITAANSDGLWSEKDDAITIIIAPPFWQTWWFKTLMVLVVALIIYAIVKNYLNRKLQAQQREFEKQQAIEKVRSKISMDIHDEISSGLTKISLLSQRVKTKFESKKEVEPETIDKIADSSKEVINNLGEIIWAVNPKHDNLQSLLAYIRNYAFNFFEQTSLQLNINFPEEINAVVISPDIKHNLFLVIKEALNNIIKHAEATSVDVSFNYNNQSYQFTIKDNGKGLHNLNGSTFGNGLTNMKKRMQAIGGKINFKNEEGTTLIIEGNFT